MDDLFALFPELAPAPRRRPVAERVLAVRLKADRARERMQRAVTARRAAIAGIQRAFYARRPRSLR
jgi:hypothetical protein